MNQIRTDRRKLKPTILQKKISLSENGNISFFERDIPLNYLTYEQKSKFVEEAILNIASIEFVSIESYNGSRTLIKGVEHAKALSDFTENKYPLNNLMILKELNGCYFKDIPPLKQANFEDLKFQELVLQPPTEIEVIMFKTKNLDLDLTFEEIEKIIKKND